MRSQSRTVVRRAIELSPARNWFPIVLSTLGLGESQQMSPFQWILATGGKSTLAAVRRILFPSVRRQILSSPIVFSIMAAVFLQITADIKKRKGRRPASVQAESAGVDGRSPDMMRMYPWYSGASVVINRSLAMHVSSRPYVNRLSTMACATRKRILRLFER